MCCGAARETGCGAARETGCGAARERLLMCSARQVSRRACFHGLALLRNLQVDAHKDRSDVPNGWVAMVCLGDFSGGYLALPDLGVKLDFKPGDIILFRSRLLEHFVTDFEGDRSSIVFVSDFESHEIVKTLCNIHNEGVIHNDIKPENILVRRHGNICHVMMIDFALSKRSADMKRARNEMACLKRMLGV